MKLLKVKDIEYGGFFKIGLHSVKVSKGSNGLQPFAGQSTIIPVDGKEAMKVLKNYCGYL